MLPGGHRVIDEWIRISWLAVEVHVDGLMGVTCRSVGPKPPTLFCPGYSISFSNFCEGVIVFFALGPTFNLPNQTNLPLKNYMIKIIRIQIF